MTNNQSNVADPLDEVISRAARDMKRVAHIHHKYHDGDGLDDDDLDFLVSMIPGSGVLVAEAEPEEPEIPQPSDYFVVTLPKKDERDKLIRGTMHKSEVVSALAQAGLKDDGTLKAWMNHSDPGEVFAIGDEGRGVCRAIVTNYR